MKVVCMLKQDDYKPGDQPPEGYLAWHEWADVQRKAGIKQVQCGLCGLWRTPQELSDQTMRWTAQSRKGPVEQTAPVCNKCAAPNAELNGARRASDLSADHAQAVGNAGA
jgi:hypothetical protein